jgi:hypothetical protein
MPRKVGGSGGVSLERRAAWQPGNECTEVGVVHPRVPEHRRLQRASVAPAAVPDGGLDLDTPDGIIGGPTGNRHAVRPTRHEGSGGLATRSSV